MPSTLAENKKKKKFEIFMLTKCGGGGAKRWRMNKTNLMIRITYQNFHIFSEFVNDCIFNKWCYKQNMYLLVFKIEKCLLKFIEVEVETFMNTIMYVFINYR